MKQEVKAPAPSRNNTASTYRPDIDGLRAVAVLSVVGYHFFPVWIQGGFVGVDIFFVISGFLIGGILLDSLRENRFSLPDFYARRIRRIFPALLLVMSACLVFGWFALLPDDYENLGKHTAGGAGFVANLMFWQEAGYFDVAAERKPLLHLWSLGVEEQFYLVVPVILWGLWKKNLRLVTFVVLLALASFGWNIAAYKKYPAFDFYSPSTRFWELFAGVLLALWERKAGDRFSEGIAAFLSIAGTALLLLAVISSSQEWGFPGKQALIPVLGAVFLIASGPSAWVNRALLAAKPAVWVGLIGYPLYLWHWPLLAYARIILGEMPRRDTCLGLLGNR